MRAHRSQRTVPNTRRPLLAEAALAIRDASDWGLVVDAAWRLMYMADRNRLTDSGDGQLAATTVGDFFFDPHLWHVNAEARMERVGAPKSFAASWLDSAASSWRMYRAGVTHSSRGLIHRCMMSSTNSHQWTQRCRPSGSLLWVSTPLGSCSSPLCGFATTRVCCTGRSCSPSRRCPPASSRRRCSNATLIPYTECSRCQAQGVGPAL
jgi:hypothetical protein